VKQFILILLFAAGSIGLSQHLHAQIIDGTTPYTFSNSAGVININGANLLLEDYVGTDGGIYNDWVVGDYSEEGPGGLDLEYATTCAQWLTGGPVAFGTLIGSAGTYSGNFETPTSSFSDLYYGLDYTVSGGDVEYGWAEISYDSTSGDGTIVAAALDTNPNEQITAGAVPEPSTFAIVGLGALILAMTTRRKRLAPVRLISTRAESLQPRSNSPASSPRGSWR
jgi:hypothetical protein